MRLCDESLCGDLTALAARVARLEEGGLPAASGQRTGRQQETAAPAARPQEKRTAPVEHRREKPASKAVDAPPPWEDPVPIGGDVPPWEDPAPIGGDAPPWEEPAPSREEIRPPLDDRDAPPPDDSDAPPVVDRDPAPRPGLLPRRQPPLAAATSGASSSSATRTRSCPCTSSCWTMPGELWRGIC